LIATDHIIGLRLNGLKFFFYAIPISHVLLSTTAMETETRAKEATVVTALRNDRLDSREFNWENQADRGKIITVLDRLKAIVKKRGNDSELTLTNPNNNKTLIFETEMG
jgi:hypothetical protein